ncbi:VanW like protein [Moorella thermoacetica]|uniref:VanW like protein n=1 Tax=Neomoorella thermoacetica TaxID=1525 RepID=A0A1J5JLA9_NEOTH|nr:VanW like protein [Moorella thermoacetica]
METALIRLPDDGQREMENLLRAFYWLVVLVAFFFAWPVLEPALAADPVVAYEDPDTQRAMIAVRDFSTVLGGEVDWEAATSTVSIRVYGRPALYLDVKAGTLAGVPLQPRPQIKDGVTYAPLRQVAEALGARVDWREDGIHVYTPAGEQVSIKYIHLLGRYTITFPEKEAGSPSLHNARLAGQYFNGLVVPPGGVVSFNNVVGPRTGARGFVPGIIFMGDQKVPEIGGGICRTATLLHNAVLSAGLEVVERHRHGLPVTYVPPGYDATVYYGVLDYRFRNNRPVPIKLEFTSQGSSITMAIWELG